VCECQHGFTGMHCENELDECFLRNCSVCVNGTCQCPLGTFNQHVIISLVTFLLLTD